MSFCKGQKKYTLIKLKNFCILKDIISLQFLHKPDVVHDNIYIDMADINNVKCVDWSKHIVNLEDKSFDISFI